MKALVYHGPGQRGWDTVADPTIIDPTDIVVRIDTSTICGSDLHILEMDAQQQSQRRPSAISLCASNKSVAGHEPRFCFRGGESQGRQERGA
jgi:threonine dehydrogenase-like Zn-dependent dehydrogenase